MPAKKTATKSATKSVAAAKSPAKKAAPKKAVATKSVSKAAPKKVAAPKAPPAPAKKAVPKAARALVEVRFERYSPESGSVELVGSFNGWKVGATPLKRGKDGVWSAKLKLEPGTYEYKYVYDGSSYEPDPDREQVQGPFGANSLLVVA